MTCNKLLAHKGAVPTRPISSLRPCISVHYFRSLLSLLSILAHAGIAAFAAGPAVPDNVGFIGDTVLPKSSKYLATTR